MKFLDTFLLLLISSLSFSQINEGGQPLSFTLPISDTFNHLSLPSPSLDSIQYQDSLQQIDNRLAVNIPIHLSILNNGSANIV
jgi:hypothetical protein